LQQIRLGLQGYAGTGKTWSATTFPNPVFLNLDRGLGAHTGHEGIIEIPIWAELQKREAVERFLDGEALKLTPHQTLIVDGSTGLQNAFIEWYNRNKVYTKQGKEDDFAPWRLKVEFFSKLCERFKSLKCHVVYICHETPAKEKDGTYNGKLRPLMTGQFGDEIIGHFTDWYRCHSSDKPKDVNTVTPDALAKWGYSSIKEFQEMCNSFPRNTLYYWQTESDDFFDGKCSSLINFPRYIPASFTSFQKYMRKVS